MTARGFAAILGLALVATGIVLGLIPVSVGTGAPCGRVFRSDTSQLTDFGASECHSKISDRQPLVYGALALGGVILVGSALIGGAPRAGAEPDPDGAVTPNF